MDQILFLGGPRDKDILRVADTRLECEPDEGNGTYTPYEIQLFDDSRHAPVRITVMLLQGSNPCLFYETIRKLRFDDRYANLFTPYCGPSKRQTLHR